MFTDWKGVAVIVAGAGVLLFVVQRQARAAAVEVAHAVDPTSRENVIYQGFSRLLDGIAGDGQQLDWWTRANGWFNKT